MYHWKFWKSAQNILVQLFMSDAKNQLSIQTKCQKSFQVCPSMRSLKGQQINWVLVCFFDIVLINRYFGFRNNRRFQIAFYCTTQAQSIRKLTVSITMCRLCITLQFYFNYNFYNFEWYSAFKWNNEHKLCW